MILVSGFNVFPNEIEEVAGPIPGILECAAIVLPTPHSGEAVKLFVVRKDPNLTEEEVKRHCARQPHQLQAAATRGVPHGNCPSPTSASSCARIFAVTAWARKRPSPGLSAPFSPLDGEKGLVAPPRSILPPPCASESPLPPAWRGLG